MDHLPLEILNHILSFLDLESLKSAIQTNKRIYGAGENPILWKDITLTLTESNSEIVFQTRKFNLVKKFYCNVMDNDILCNLNHKAFLSSLHLSNDVTYANVNPHRLGFLISKTELVSLHYIFNWVYWNKVLTGIGYNDTSNPSTKCIILNLDETGVFKLLHMHTWSTSKLKKSKLGFENLVSHPQSDLIIDHFSAKIEFYDLLSDDWDLGLDSVEINITLNNPTPNFMLWKYDMRLLQQKIYLMFQRADSGIEF